LTAVEWCYKRAVLDTLFTIVVIALTIVGAVTATRWLLRLAPRARHDGTPSTDAAHGAVEDARAAALELGYDELAVERFERDPDIAAHVDRLTRPDVPLDAVLALTGSETSAVAALGFFALAHRDDVPREWTTRAISTLASCDAVLEPFVYRALLENAGYPIIGPALCKLDEGINWEALARFVEARMRAGEHVDAETFRRNVPLRMIGSVESFIDRFEPYLGGDFRVACEEWRAGAVDVEFLNRVGRVLERPYDEPPVYLNERRTELVELIAEAIESEPRRSVLLVGEHGVGKSALVRVALERHSSELVVFEATAAQINAGAVYVGALEGRIEELVAKLSGHNAVWLLPAFEETLYAGQHSRSPKGMLDALLAHVERGALSIVGEITPGGLEALLAERPRVAGAFDIVRVRPLDESGAVAAAGHALSNAGLRASTGTLVEAYELAQQFLPGLAAPGNMLRLVAATATIVQEDGRDELDSSDVLTALALSSGLPLALLDPHSALDLDEVRGFFESRVLGQPEAVETLVERIAIVKAGLNDPTRPLGVFLFVGPTGTGKTEIAKALAEFMFGTERRLIRVDMSEFQTPDALDRLLQDTTGEQRGSVLLSAVRKEPFAVVLLDEFEKAAPPVWDLFLQVFDDGRLTDHRGRTADFRRCIIVLTSNVGSAVAHRPSVGFQAEHGRFRADLVDRELKRSFRPEFLNRIDRIVVFRPFQRSQMRALLDKELAETLARRGLRGRPWAVELDDSAYEFLIERGFTPELGARPLKRAVERYLLAPIAQAIVQQAVPEGDQFLLVSAPRDEQIDVTFVDPDAPEPESVRDVDRDQAPMDVRSVARSGMTGGVVVGVLLDELRRISAVVHGELGERKERALRAMQEPGFWDDSGRRVVLAEAEYLDRLEAACATAEKMARRLESVASRNGGGRASELTSLLALRIHVLDAAIDEITTGEPSDVLLRLRLARESDVEEGRAWVESLAAMYGQWAVQRGMRIRRADPGEHAYVVAGLGARTILAPEAGLHVFETTEDPERRRETERVAVVVDVVPWPNEPAEQEELLRRPLTSPASGRATSAVVRRYRRVPSPLVRDAVRGYRTGRLDRVLAGDFDLF
jgi:ATP-dependent Clp protease ATP-binding subunit ClpC